MSFSLLCLIEIRDLMAIREFWSCHVFSDYQLNESRREDTLMDS